MFLFLTVDIVSTFFEIVSTFFEITSIREGEQCVFTVKNGVATYEILNNYAEPLLSVKNGVIDLRKTALINRKRGIHVFNPIVVNLINARLVEDAMRF